MYTCLASTRVQALPGSTCTTLPTQVYSRHRCNIAGILDVCGSAHSCYLHMPAGLANFTLLPELLSTTKEGSTSFPNVAYNNGTDLPTVKRIKAFAQVHPWSTNTCTIIFTLFGLNTLRCCIVIDMKYTCMLYNFLPARTPWFR
jgi:hypothetical protein